MRYLFCLLSLFFLAQAQAQTDTTSFKEPKRVYTKYDSIYMARLNNSGNLMIAGGVGLCGAGGYLIYQGLKIYRTPAMAGSTNPAAEVDRNHRQGTIYLVAAGVGIGGGIILTALGARNKIDFRRRKKQMQLQLGVLDSGQIGTAFTF